MATTTKTTRATTTTTTTRATTTIKRKSKDKFDPVQNLMLFGEKGNGGTDPLILNLDSRGK